MKYNAIGNAEAVDLKGTFSMTVYEIYDQTIKPLSTDDRSRLIALILDDLTPHSPNTIRDHAHLENLLLESLDGETHEVTDETWMRRFERILLIPARIT